MRFALNYSGVMAAALLCTVIGIASTPAQARPSRCDSIEDRDRRQRCRSAELDAERYAEEAKTWREAEREISDRHKRGCRAVGRVGSVGGIGREARLACDAPRIINDARERRRK